MALYNSLVDALNSERGNGRHISFFCKSMYLFLLFKIFLLWPLLSDISEYRTFSYTSPLSYLLFAPLALTKISLHLFLYSFAILIVPALVIKLNYFTSFLVCWFSISLSRLFFPVINGSDSVLNLFLLISILLPARPKFKNIEWKEAQNFISNTGLILAQIQLALIYFLSGYDKLLSPAWRSGAAIDSISQLKFYHNPFLNLNLNETICLILSWSVIFFELAFALLIWFRYARRFLLIVGAMFHLAIGVYLGLFDFALVMVLCYGVYLPFKKTSSGPSIFSGI